MKSVLSLLPLLLCPVCVQAADDVQMVLNRALDAAQEQQSENMGPVISAVLDAGGGDEQVFWSSMQRAAEAGHPVALTWQARQRLAQLRSQQVPIESAEAAVKLRAAVEQAAAAGYAPALLEMAHLCGSGVGAPADEKQGMEYLMQACRAGSPRARAAYLLISGRLEKEGKDSPAVVAELKRNNYFVEEMLASLEASRDEAASREWMELAASHGSPGAAGMLAFYYLQQGKEALAYDFLKQAAERDHPEALAQLAAFSVPGAEVPAGLKPLITPDAPQAVRLFQRAALQGYTPALIPLAGEYHKQPEQFPASRVFDLYRRAADAGDPRGGVAYAYCLAAGRGCAPDAARGVRVLQQLVDAGVPFANLALADLYFNGTGVEADMARALQSLSAAAAAGVPQSYTLMAVLAQLGNASRASEPSRARVYLRMAQERGEINPEGAFEEMVRLGSWKFMP